jgi:hypothetical protein
MHAACESEELRSWGEDRASIVNGKAKRVNDDIKMPFK